MSEPKPPVEDQARAEAPPQPEPAAQPAQATQPEAAALEARVRELEQAVEQRERDMVERLARLQADFENFRRRAREESALAQGRGKEALLKALLPVVDNLERAIRHSQDEGLRLLARQLDGVLAAQQVVVLDPQGEAFDARVHEAIAQEAREGAKPGTVLAVVEKGYQIDGRVVRPARVIVAQ